MQLFEIFHIVERILSIPVSISYTETMSSGSTSILPVSLLQDLFGTLTIWNTSYLEWLLFGILSYSTGFSKFHWFHSLPIYYRIPSVLRESINSHSTSLHVQQNRLDRSTFPATTGKRMCLLSSNAPFWQAFSYHSSFSETKPLPWSVTIQKNRAAFVFTFNQRFAKIVDVCPSHDLLG